MSALLNPVELEWLRKNHERAKGQDGHVTDFAACAYPLCVTAHTQARPSESSGAGGGVARLDIAPLIRRLANAIQERGRKASSGEPLFFDRLNLELLIADELAAALRGPQEYHKLDTDRQVFFYEQDFYVLSNFSAFRLNWKGILFDTSEQAYQWEKFPHVQAIQTAILDAFSAHDAFKLAEGWKGQRREDWDAVKVGIMREILRAKVEQHEYVRRKLLASGDRELIEDSWRDDFWGWGSNRNGQNMLGRLWMEIRTELISKEQPWRLPPAPRQNSIASNSTRC